MIRTIGQCTKAVNLTMQGTGDGTATLKAWDLGQTRCSDVPYDKDNWYNASDAANVTITLGAITNDSDSDKGVGIDVYQEVETHDFDDFAAGGL